jgi:hypothetical protein
VFISSVRRSRLMMELSRFINLIFILALNVLFFFSGISLNSVVILSIRRSVQLRKKLCYFMIMVLSCFDLLVVVTNHPFTALVAMLELTGKLSYIYPSWMDISGKLSDIFIGFSLLALLVMNFDRYLATSYPIFHRTSVTKGNLLTLLAILIIMFVTLALISHVCDVLISDELFVLICFGILFGPMLFINYKLFRIARKSRRNNRISPEIEKTFSLKNITSCLLAVACFVVLNIPVFVYIGLSITSKGALTFDNVHIAALWAKTITSMNSTCNCLIFYWKDKMLRTEGLKILKKLKLRGSL